MYQLFSYLIIHLPGEQKDCCINFGEIRAPNRKAPKQTKDSTQLSLHEPVSLLGILWQCG